MNSIKLNEKTNVEREGWKSNKITREGSNTDPDENVRELLRGDESKGEPDERDIVGAPDSSDTPHGRQEDKKK